MFKFSFILLFINDTTFFSQPPSYVTFWWHSSLSPFLMRSFIYEWRHMGNHHWESFGPFLGAQKWFQMFFHTTKPRVSHQHQISSTSWTKVTMSLLEVVLGLPQPLHPDLGYQIVQRFLKMVSMISQTQKHWVWYQKNIWHDQNQSYNFTSWGRPGPPTANSPWSRPSYRSEA